MIKAMNGTSVRLDREVRVHEMEQALMNCLAGPGADAEELVVDLGQTRYLHPVAALYLLAIARSWTQRERRFVLRLPRDGEHGRRVRDFLRVWNFPRALEFATGLEFIDLVVPEDREFFYEGVKYYSEGEKWLPPAGAAHNRPAARALRELERRRFFGFVPYELAPRNPDTSVVEREWSRWRAPLVKSVLNSYLGRAGDDVPRAVIAELALNAVDHPQAKQLYAVSYVDRRKPSREPVAFTLSMWDDGLGIVDTLRACLDQGGPIRIRETKESENFIIQSEGWTPNRKKLDARSWNPVADTSDQELLLASMFDGITRRAGEMLSTGEDELKISVVGNGLYSLYTSVLNGLNGTVAVRSGSFFMNLKKDRRGPRLYQAKIVDYRSRRWPSFAGNMLTIRVPVSNA